MSDSPPRKPQLRWAYWLSGQAFFNGLSKGYQKLRAFLEKSPAFETFERIAKSVAARVFGVVRLPARIESRLEPVLEIEAGRKMDPVVSFPILVLFAGLGLYPSSLGHMDTTPHLFTLLPLVGVLNPYLGACSALVFAVFDWAGKWMYPVLSVFGSWIPVESVYGGNLSDGFQNFLGARIGYVFAYSTVLLTALLPGVLSRLFRMAAYRIARKFLGRPAVSGAAGMILLGISLAALAHLTGSGTTAVLATIPVFLFATTAWSKSLGVDDTDAMSLSMATVGSVAGAVFGGVLGNIYARGLGNWLAFEAARATPDLSCRAVSEGNYLRHRPWTMTAAGVGGFFPPGSAGALIPKEWLPPSFGGPLVTGNPESVVDFRPPVDMPEPVPTEKTSESKHPECDELYGRLREAIDRYREAQAERAEVWRRLKRAHGKQQLNTTVLIFKTGIEVGGYAAAGTEAIRGLTRHAAMRTANVTDDIRAAKARGSMLAESTRQIQARLNKLRASVPGLRNAQRAVDDLSYRQDLLDRRVFEERRKHWSDHPSTAPNARKDLDRIEIDTNKVARDEILEDIARKGYATPAQEVELERLWKALEEAQARHLKREAEAFRKGWKPDFDEYLEAKDPELLREFYGNVDELAKAQRHLKEVEAVTPPHLLEEIERLKGRLDGIQRAQAEGALPEGFFKTEGPDGTVFGPGHKSGDGNATRVVSPPDTAPIPDPSGRIPPRTPPYGTPGTSSKFWNVPKPPEWIRSAREAVENGIGVVFSPLGRLFRWAFVGEIKPQTPEEIGRILQQGIDTIKRLQAEHEAKQAVVDSIRAQVDRMRSALERCNQGWE